eukprot:gene24059-25711_t
MDLYFQLEILMDYQEVIVRALKGRSVTATAKAWGLPQKTLDRYAKAERLPDYETAMKIADEAAYSVLRQKLKVGLLSLPQ